MKYSNVIAKLSEPLLITPQRHAALCQILESRLESGVQSEMPSQSQRDPDGLEDASPQAESYGNVAIIPVHGTLVKYPEDIAMSECGCSMEVLNEMIEAAESDPRIETVLYDFRTPGGSVTGIPETGRKILHSRKQTVGFFDSECCSGGAWLAAQCQRLYGTQSARFGSIGVYTLSLDMSEAMKKAGTKMNAVSAGKFKLLGAYWKPLEDDERAIMQARVDKIYEQFKVAMESNRIVRDENFGNGLIFDGDEATELGFIDGVVEDRRDVLELIAGD